MPAHRSGRPGQTRWAGTYRKGHKVCRACELASEDGVQEAGAIYQALVIADRMAQQALGFPSSADEISHVMDVAGIPADRIAKGIELVNIMTAGEQTRQNARNN